MNTAPKGIPTKGYQEFNNNNKFSYCAYQKHYREEREERKKYVMPFTGVPEIGEPL